MVSKIFPQCAAKGSRLWVGVWQVGLCLPTVGLGTVWVLRYGRAVGRRSQNAIRMMCWTCSQIACFYCVWWHAFLYCVAVAILWKCANASASFSRGRHTLCADAFSWQAQQFVTQRRWFLMNRSVRTAQTWHGVKSRGRGQRFVICLKSPEAAQKSYTFWPV